ncbi:MAG: UvrD-helicase domain-containing protein [Candidatus Coproplasma sp.]
MGWSIFKKTAKPAEITEVEEFNKKLNELLAIDGYISVKDYSFLVEQFKGTNQTFVTINSSDLLSIYCKKNKIEIELITKFLSDYGNIKAIISRHNKEYVDRAMVREKEYLDSILFNVDKDVILDDDQRKVVLTDEDYCLVIAGAGAGKTTTVAAKVKYLVDKKGIKPEEILIVSFTNKAVGELRDRINKALNIPCPITTFHSAGNAILRKKSDEKLNIVEDGFLFNTIRDYLLVKLKDKKTADNLVLFFGSYFNTEYEGTDKREYLNSIVKADYSTLKSNLNEYNYTYVDRSTKRKVTLNNEVVKSYQEVEIANYLYLNGIDYEYEPSYPYYIFMAKKRYSPDFVIRQNGKEIYLEHFGITENGENRRYTEEELERYKKAIRDKIYIHKKHGTKLIYTYSQYNDGRSLTEHLAEMLKACGIEANPRSSEEILEKLTRIQENKYIMRMVFLICDFIKNFKTNGYTEDKFYEFGRIVKSERTKLFLEICRECYLEYQRALSKNNAVDFQDMINDAARALKEVAALKEKLHFKYIIIDEYQDISRQRFDMAKELSIVTDAKIIAVGDDWQSIFAFSGSDVTLFTKFCQIMGYGEELKITSTYRNAKELIDIAGGFIQKNDSQIKKTLQSPKHIQDPVVIVSYDDTPKKWNERASEGGPINKMAKALEYAIGEIVSRHGQNTGILLIGRYNYDGEMLSRTDAFEYNATARKVCCKKYPHADITFLTAHSSKGLGYDNVIIINAKDAVYGFPSKIDEDPVMKLVIKNSDEFEYAEERRLFYVALTRTKNRVYIIAPEKHPSEFVLELKREYKNVVLKGEFNPEPHGLITNKVCPVCGYPLQRRHRKDCAMNLWVCTNEPEVCGFVSNNLAGGRMYIQKCTECVDGYLIVKTKDDHPFLGCTNYTRDGKGCNKTISPQEFDSTADDNGIIEMDIFEGSDEVVSEEDAAMENLPVYSLPDASDDKEEAEVTDEEAEVTDEVTDEELQENSEEEDEEDEEDEEGQAEPVDLTAEGIARLVIDTCAQISKVKCFGVTMIVDVLHGSKKQKLINCRFDELESYGVLGAINPKSIQEITEWLIEENYLYKTNGPYPTVRVNRDKDAEELENADLSVLQKILSPYSIAEEPIVEVEECLTVLVDGWHALADSDGNVLTDMELFKKLRALRMKIADERYIPYYCVAQDKVLIQLATLKPTKKEQFLKIKGIGEKWFENNGQAFMQVICEHLNG